MISKKVSDFILDLVFPSRCINCGLIGENYICHKCFKSLEILKGFKCIDCGLRTDFGKTCLNCSEKNAVDQLFVVADYNDPLIKKAIQIFKYSFIRELSDPLSELACKYLKWLAGNRKHLVFDRDTIITAVPLSRRRINWRGFNQSELIAKNISNKLLVKSNFGILRRVGRTKIQAEIQDREDRVNNSPNVGYHGLAGEITGKIIVVVDDVSTTGTTLNGCARVLKKAGAKEVIGLVIARG